MAEGEEGKGPGLSHWKRTSRCMRFDVGNYSGAPHLGVYAYLFICAWAEY